MAEYIEREALRKVLENWRDAHADVDDEQGCGLLEDVIWEVDAQPIADVAPVTRCKDCEYGDYDSKPDGAMVCLRTKDGFWRNETDFCSYGTPKNDGGET